MSGLDNANKIFNHCKKNKINIFSHKIGWNKVLKLEDMPIHHTEGLIFISSKNIKNFLPKKTNKINKRIVKVLKNYEN